MSGELNVKNPPIILQKQSLEFYQTKIKIFGKGQKIVFSRIGPQLLVLTRQ